MKVTLSWLREHIDLLLHPYQICESLSISGTETSLQEGSEWANNFFIAYIENVIKHENADKLSVCSVRYGEKKLSVVCGAANVRPGMKTILAIPGSILPGSHVHIKESSVRGVKSEGMLCSAKELCIESKLEKMGLKQETEGIIELCESAVEGTTLSSLLPYDPILELEITPNRGDLLGVRGIAKELSSLGCGTLKPYRFREFDDEKCICSDERPVEIMGEILTEACSELCLCSLRGINNKSSCSLISERIASIGLKTISPIVDITNYLCIDSSRPVHAYDLDKIRGKIHVRLSNDKEKFRGLDGVDYVLDQGAIVVCDDEGIISIAGILGGERTACKEDTKNVIIESGNFDASTIAITARKSRIKSESSFRFERGVDNSRCAKAVKICSSMIAEYCGGADIVTQTEIKTTSRALRVADPFRFEYSDVKKLSGASISNDEILKRLCSLWCYIKSHDQEGAEIIAPSWRNDIRPSAEDYVEEILRINGYADIPSNPFLYSEALLKSPLLIQRRVRSLLISCGFFEAITWSFMQRRMANLFTHNCDAIKGMELKNPISSELSVMRPSIIPNLLSNAVYHIRKNVEFSPIFEIGKVFFEQSSDGEHTAASGIIPTTSAREQSLFFSKEIVEKILLCCGVKWSSIKNGGPSWFHPGRSLTYYTGNKVIAVCGQIHPKIDREFDEKLEIAAFEVNLSYMPEFSVSFPKPPYIIPQLQQVEKDLSFVIDKNYQIGELFSALSRSVTMETVGISLIDIFSDEEKVGTGKKSVSIRCTFQPKDKAFSDNDLRSMMLSIVKSAEECGAELRGDLLTLNKKP
ncbi:phenylalanine--tRNA ligase subunit beta [Candidatus Hydrogenosomobacter endosymbioticus]|uniref:Phenylalanine--tRNA ligase beta subunit n=1 Tax=Candidatus Hydrogenosomobacter endosymbioticus TaxID=2558174 RepID=A0ABN6L2E3_9PROT|nr:phenylalanine--tRNA ligase subunit beta [Candidatus Hydrogenosomobacter endosymbioticus]BDB96011.1 phenylalanine--tRNA ligase beta subunit [Candidatus Hydrogenosomobacter endosymbioticus]